MDVGAPAVVAAIHDATGVWIHELPASPERILAALGRDRRRRRAGGVRRRRGARTDAEATIDAPIDAREPIPRPDAADRPAAAARARPDDRRVDDGWHDA